MNTFDDYIVNGLGSIKGKFGEISNHIDAIKQRIESLEQDKLANNDTLAVSADNITNARIDAVSDEFKEFRDLNRQITEVIDDRIVNLELATGKLANAETVEKLCKRSDDLKTLGKVLVVNMAKVIKTVKESITDCDHRVDDNVAELSKVYTTINSRIEKLDTDLSDLWSQFTDLGKEVKIIGDTVITAVDVIKNQQRESDSNKRVKEMIDESIELITEGFATLKARVDSIENATDVDAAAKYGDLMIRYNQLSNCVINMAVKQHELECKIETLEVPTPAPVETPTEAAKVTTIRVMMPPSHYAFRAQQGDLSYPISCVLVEQYANTHIYELKFNLTKGKFDLKAKSLNTSTWCSVVDNIVSYE
jgi:chromosome segregation ATPase